MLTRRETAAGIAAATLALSASDVAHAEDAAARPLLAPRSTGGMPLIDALKLRRSTRAYSERPLEPQVLSDLLWAANGVNRPSSDRTAPYWRHIMVIDIYAAMADGVWLYDPQAHALVLHGQADLRAESGTQDFVGVAPLDLVYVAHGERMTDVGPKNAVSLLRRTPALSDRTYICFARRKGSSRCFAAPRTKQISARPSTCRRVSS